MKDSRKCIFYVKKCTIDIQVNNAMKYLDFHGKLSLQLSVMQGSKKFSPSW